MSGQPTLSLYGAARRTLAPLGLHLPPGAEIAARLVERRARSDPTLRPLYDAFTDEQAKEHYGGEPLEEPQLRAVVRLFHAWKAATLRARLQAVLLQAAVLDVGDSDGLLLQELGKTSIGFNISNDAIRNIRRNGVEAVQGDAHALPFSDGSFDVVLCFETLEHSESPHTILMELARVCRPDGRCFVSIPWVPSTNVCARVPGRPRGEDHVFELAPDHLAALVTHTPFRIAFEDDCWVFGPPQGLLERAYLWRNRHRHVVANTFRGFHFIELCHRAV